MDNFTSCRDAIGNVSQLTVLSSLAPMDRELWEGRGAGWDGAFISIAAILGVLFLLVGTTGLVLFFKNKQRLRAKAFSAAYLTIAIIGISRFVYFSMDPSGVLRLIAAPFPHWVTVSRLVNALGLPSLTTSYTLLLLTLWNVTNTRQIGKKWYHKWKFVIPLTLFFYAIAFTAEILSNISPYPSLVSILLCDLLLVVWGVFVCAAYILASRRVISSIHKHSKKCSRIGDGESASESRIKMQMERRQTLRHQQSMQTAMRKVKTIALAAAVLGLLYSVANAVNLVLTGLFVFQDCVGFRSPGNAAAWLVLQAALRFIELALSCVILYAVTDMTGLVTCLRWLLHRFRGRPAAPGPCCFCCCCSASGSNSNERTRQQSMSELEECMTDVNGEPCTPVPVAQPLEQPSNRYTIEA